MAEPLPAPEQRVGFGKHAGEIRRKLQGAARQHPRLLFQRGNLVFDLLEQTL
jgi:hypothetical protein